MKCSSLAGLVLIILLNFDPATCSPEELLQCSDLQVGQYLCSSPEIDNETQQPTGCDENTETVEVPCYPHAGIHCQGPEGSLNHTGDTVGFYQSAPCHYTNGQHFSVALLLSVFLGMFGVDRFYLGYPAIGLLKFCTLGFMFLGQLVDILLIALQVVGPSDRSYYIIDYYGAVLKHVKSDNLTYIVPQYENEYDYYAYNYEL